MQRIRRLLHEKRLELAALGGMGLLYFCSYFQRVAVPGTIFDPLQADFAVPAAGVTALGAIFLYVYGGSQIFVGMMADRFGGARVLLVGSVVMVLGTVLFPLSGNIWVLYASRALIGLGSGFMYLSIVKEVDALFGSKNFAPLLGILIFVGYAGGLMGTFPLERGVDAFGWRPAMLAAGIFSAVALGAVALLLYRLPTTPRDPEPLSLGRLREIILNVRSAPVLFTSSVNWAVYFLVQTTVGKKFLQDFAGVGSATAAGFTFVMMGVAMGTVFFSGLLSRLMGNRRRPLVIISAGLTLAATGLLVVGIGTGAPAWLFLLCYAMLAVSSGCAPLFVAAMKELNPPRNVALSVSVLNTVCYLGVAVLANAAGFVLDAFRADARILDSVVVYPAKAYGAMFGGLLVLTVLSFISSLLIGETRGRSLYGTGQPPTCA